MADEESGLVYTLSRGNMVVGTKRFGGYACRACNLVSLLCDGEQSARCATRRHYTSCVLCGGSSDVTVPCATFDWNMAPNLVPRAPPAAAAAAAAAAGNDTIRDQYGNVYSLDVFWRRVVDPCPLQFYDRISHAHRVA